MGATVPAGGDLRDGRRRCPRSGAAAGGETTAMGEGRASSCSPRAELGDVSDWFPMLGMFSSSSPPAPILPFARVLDLLPKGVTAIFITIGPANFFKLMAFISTSVIRRMRQTLADSVVVMLPRQGVGRMLLLRQILR